eukprot:3086884-Ditylum_brightwellii.AAC.1
MALELFVPTMLVTVELSIYAKSKHLDDVYSSSVNTKLFIHDCIPARNRTIQMSCPSSINNMPPTSISYDFKEK